MSEYIALSWQNENGLTNYPLTLPFEINDLIVDASFIQFDNYVPTFSSVLIGENYMTFNLIFDLGEVSATYNQSDYSAGIKNLRFYDNGGDRYLGCLTIGVGATKAWDSYVGENLIAGATLGGPIPFVASTVKSIPLNDAVYTLDGSYGEIYLGANQDVADSFADIGGIIYQTSAGGNTIFYNSVSSPPSITFNAVGNSVPPASNNIYPLKQINLTKPKNNNITIGGNDVIKFNSINNQNLEIYVVGQGGASSSNLVLTTLSM
jgi:hypothetical protein